MNAAEWLRLGFLMDFAPPVTLVPGPKSTYTRVRKTEATSIRDLRVANNDYDRELNEAVKTITDWYTVLVKASNYIFQIEYWSRVKS